MASLDADAGSPDPILTLSALSKRFAGVLALDDVSLDVRAGEIHALVGENGAGKSTLIKILAGNQRADQGAIVFKGKAIAPRAPSEAREVGISAIYQELTVIPYLSVAENIFLGALPTNRWGIVEQRKLHDEARAVLSRLGMDMDPFTTAGELAIGHQQMVEIAKSLASRAELLIMDEPTSSLSHHEAERFWRVIEELRKGGKTIIFVSHKLDEVFGVANRVTVLRDGRKIATRSLQEVNPDQLVTMMVGHEVHYQRAAQCSSFGRDALVVTGLERRGKFSGVGFTARAGEIVGFAGLVGAGRTEVMRAIFGADRADAGRVLVEGKALHLGDPRRAIRAGIAYLPENRKEQALFLRMSVLENLSLPGSQSGAFGVLDRTAEAKRAAQFIARLRIVTASFEEDVVKLSGGNQQKVVLARWLATMPKILIVDEPTRGIDVGAKAEIHELLRGLAREGVAVIVVSSELPEVLALSDRILVMRSGRIVADVPAASASEVTIGALAVGLPTAGLSNERH
jgi:ABC-type sugar transport system ATPase subunit